MRTCPRCGAIGFEDIELCYGCLYRFRSQTDEKKTFNQDVSGLLTVVVRYPDESEGRFDLSKGRVDIGRSSENDIVLTDRTVSRFHARISSDDSGVWVEDRGSANLTYLDGAPLLRRQKMQKGSRLDIRGSLVWVETS